MPDIPKNVYTGAIDCVIAVATGDWPCTCSQKGVKTDNFMKTRILVGLCVVLAANFISVRAEDDTPEQAAARAALEQKMVELDRAPAQPSPNQNFVAVTVRPGEVTTKATGTVATKAVTPQTGTAATILVAVPATVAPAAKASITVAPAETTPVAAGPAAAASAHEVSVATASDMAADRAALDQKMYELDQSQAQPQPDANRAAAVTQPGESTTHATATPPIAPATASIVSAPVDTAPAAVTSVATTPVAAPAPVAPVSAAPTVAAPAPKVSIAPAIAAPVAVAPAATVQSVAAPTKSQPVAAPAAYKPALVLHAATLPSTSPGLARPGARLVTTTGSVYQNVEVERVMSDSIIISYTPAGGGWSMTKVNFSDLPAGFRQQYEKK